eukprot:Hpha_TRINITY_DN16237_c1_g7::TRINITY_DN16237_c1_g7_i1::g.16504::m.16504
MGDPAIDRILGNFGQSPAADAKRKKGRALSRQLSVVEGHIARVLMGKPHQFKRPSSAGRLGASANGTPGSLTLEALSRLPGEVDDHDEDGDQSNVAEDVMVEVTETLIMVEDVFELFTLLDPSALKQREKFNFNLSERITERVGHSALMSQEDSSVAEEGFVTSPRMSSAYPTTGGVSPTELPVRSFTKVEWALDDDTVAAALGAIGLGPRQGGASVFGLQTPTVRGDRSVDQNCGILNVMDTAAGIPPWDLGHGLFLSNAAGALEMERLLKLGVTHVLRLSEETDVRQEKACAASGIELTHILAEDSPHYNLLPRHLIEARNAWKQAKLQGGGFVVHCHAGLNRSVCVCVALMITCLGMKLTEAMETVTRARENQVLLNRGFRRQLVDLAAACGLLLPL